MAERKWTPSQLEAIGFNGKNLILSAAAGSGKTATLTERIIRLLKSPESGAELSRMLIVTFTVAAAGELRSRIADALNDAIAKDPGNAFLTRQLASLEGAKISTIDSFFKSEIRPYFSTLGLPPDFGILDEAEAAVLKKDAMAETVAQLFEGVDTVDREAFRALADCLSVARSEGDLAEVLLKISDNLISYDISSEKLAKRADSLLESKDDFFATEYANAPKAALSRMGEHYRVRFKALSEMLSENGETQKYIQEAERLALLAESVSALADGTYSAARTYLNSITFESLSPLKKDKQTDTYITFKDMRAAFKAELSEITSDCFSADEESLAYTMRETAAHIRTLALVNDHFLNKYALSKREKGMADFSDLGRFARRIFVAPDGTPTAAAIETAKKFDYIFIDEYQDTNPVQDAVFNAVSCLCGRFMVGDVKQSIYGFRGSCPELFTGYRKEYESGDSGSAVFMSENFRSDKCVIDLSNTVSRYIFRTGSTPFEKEDELVCSKQGGDSDNRCEVILCEKEGPDGKSLPTEAQCVARRISRLLSEETLSNGEPIKPRDIAILLRSGSEADSFVKALRELNIPANNSASEEFFAYGEVLLVLCLLNAADNPLRDIYLAGALKSHVFGFSLNDLVNIRKSTKVPLWYSLTEYCDGGTDPELLEKCRNAKSTLEKWRNASRELYCDEMLRLIVSDTRLRSFGGDGTRKNSDVIRSLKILSDHAATVASRGGTLCDLISHLNSVIEKKDRAKGFADPDSVTILTVHRSKGLEFPVCILAETAKRFNTRDTSDKLLCDRSGLMAMKLYDRAGLVRCDNPLRRAVAMKMTADSAEEEARVLYVAMTRARERLIITCKTKSFEDRLRTANERALFPLDDHQVLSTSTYGDWIVDALEREGDGSFFVYKRNGDIDGICVSEEAHGQKNSEELLKYFEKSLDFSYDKEYLWNIPAKLSVSVLKPDILGAEEDSSFFDAPRLTAMPKDAPLPQFLSDKRDRDGAAVGTATHVFMQFCDYDNLFEKGASAELSRLVSLSFISKEDAALVRLSEIEGFRESELFARLRTAKKVLREKRFNTRLPAKDFTVDPSLREKLEKDNTMITVQGVVDCIFIDGDGKAVLVDYKTDRLTREELSDERLAEEKLLSRHSRQLKLYSTVCERMLGMPFSEVCIYSLPLGRTVEVK